MYDQCVEINNLNHQDICTNLKKIRKERRHISYVALTKVRRLLYQTIKTRFKIVQNDIVNSESTSYLIVQETGANRYVNFETYISEILIAQLLYKYQLPSIYVYLTFYTIATNQDPTQVNHRKKKARIFSIFSG